MHAPVTTQLSEQRRREQRVAILRALALLDANGHAIGVDIADLDVTRLRQSQARCIGGHQEGAVLQVGRVLEKRGDFLTRENLRQALGDPRARQLELRVRHLEGDAIEKLQRARHHVAAAVRELALPEQIQQILPALGLADVLG